MCDSALLKIDRATKHVAELTELLQKQRPFTYVLETNTKTGERATFAKKDEAVVANAAVIIGDAVFNMRSALDHAYWEIVSPHVPPNRYGDIQFPFRRKRKDFKETMKRRAADKISMKFLRALYRLRPYHEAGGNEMLCLIDKLCNIDKHRLLVPTGDYTELTGAMLKTFAPEIPISSDSRLAFGQNKRDIVWRVQPPLRRIRRANRIPEKLEDELDVPVQIVFAVGELGTSRPVVPTLDKLVDVAQSTIAILRNSI